MPGIPINIHHTVYSVAGSYLAFWYPPAFWGHNALMVRSLRGQPCEAMRIELCDALGKSLPYQETATSTGLRMQAEPGGWAELVMPRPDVARFRTGNGLVLRLVTVAKRPGECFAYPAGEGRWLMNCPPVRTHFAFATLKGELKVDSDWYVKTFLKKREKTEEPAVTLDLVPDENGEAEIYLEDYPSSPQWLGLEDSFEACKRMSELRWEEWIGKMPRVPATHEEAARVAMHVNFAAILDPSPMAAFKRPTMLMSKNWMLKAWSWDHCFNAIAHSYTDSDLAWDQWMTLFDHQFPDGCLPDSIGANVSSINFCKPPIHGWALLKMMANPDLLTSARAETAYECLTRWTQWWFTVRDLDGDGLPEYQHGNDSGWDNATVFEEGVPVVVPDLPAHLVMQLECLARLAEKLERLSEVASWREQRDALLTRMIAKLWDAERGQFVSRAAFTDKEQGVKGDSLQNCMAIVAGEFLPLEIREKLSEALVPDGRFVTSWGPATESPQSPLYEPDGYWRGPIWGSEAVLLIDGLARAGYRDQAREIARRYCELGRQSLCFAENYNALTGEPLRDPAYTWGSSAFLILAHEFLNEPVS